MNRDMDHTFMSLLSNQRKLLMQIQQEVTEPTGRSDQEQFFPTRSNPSNLISSTISGFSTPSRPQYQVGNDSSSSSAYQIATASFQRAQLPLHYQPGQQQQQQMQHHDVNRMYPSSQASSLPPPLPYHPFNRMQQQQQQSSSSQSNRRTNNESLLIEDDDYLLSLEPTPLRTKRLSLELATQDALQDFFTLDDSPKGRRDSRLTTTTTTTRPIHHITNQNTHDHHSMHHDHARIKVSDGLFDLDNDSPGDSSFSNLFQESFKPLAREAKDSKKQQVPNKSKQGLFDINNIREEYKQRKKNPPPPPPEVSKDDLLGSLTKTTTTKKRRREDTSEENRKISAKVQKLADALEKSAQSQQEIHQWDRKMGLKRSHSKTMTQSMQSRKKLRDLLQSISEIIQQDDEL